MTTVHNITTQTVVSCIDRAEDIGHRLERWYDGASEELSKFVSDPLTQALEAREIDSDAWDTIMYRLKWYESEHVRLIISEEMKWNPHTGN